MESLFDWTAWAEPRGAMVFWSIVGAVLVGTLLKLCGHQWDDWLDERWGRGSVRDWWLLRRIEREAERRAR